MKSPLICMLFVALAIVACAQSKDVPVQESAPKAQTAPATSPTPAPGQKPATYSLTPEESQTIYNLAMAEQQAVGEVLTAETALRAVRFERKTLQPLLSDKIKLNPKQIVHFTNVLLATNQWQEADARKQEAATAVLNWLNSSRPKDCPECQLSRDLKQWVRQ